MNYFPFPLPNLFPQRILVSCCDGGKISRVTWVRLWGVKIVFFFNGDKTALPNEFFFFTLVELFKVFKYPLCWLRFGHGRARTWRRCPSVFISISKDAASKQLSDFSLSFFILLKIYIWHKSIFLLKKFGGKFLEKKREIWYFFSGFFLVFHLNSQRCFFF